MLCVVGVPSFASAAPRRGRSNGLCLAITAVVVFIIPSGNLCVHVRVRCCGMSERELCEFAA